MIRTDRVLHFLATRREEEESIDLVAGLSGWEDREPGWPESALVNLFSRFFRSPRHALSHLAGTYQLIDRMTRLGPGEERDFEEDLDRAAGSYALALRALSLPDHELPARKGTYGSLARLLEGHLDTYPALVFRAELAALVRELTGRFQSCPDVDLALEGARLASSLERAEQLGTDSESWESLDSGELGHFESPRPRRSLPENVVEYGDLFHSESELDEEQVFRCLLEEVLRDGAVDAYEWISLGAMARDLGIGDERRRELEDEMRAVLENDPDGLDETPGALDARRLFERLHAEAGRDGTVSAGEDRVLGRVARFLCLDPEEVRAVRRARGKRRPA